MIRHIILWKLKEGLNDIPFIKTTMKSRLEGLLGVIPGLEEMKVQIEGIASSTADVMLDSTFINEEALKSYSIHPAHVAVANEAVRPFVEIRLCLDFEVPSKNILK